MNLKKTFHEDQQPIRIHYKEQTAVEELRNQVLSWLPNVPREYVVVCIGTDRSTGDALGPLTGTFLTENKPQNITVYGTVHEPVHATNLEAYLNYIHEEHRNPFIIAIDACLGRNSSVGQLTAQEGSVRPGAALKKNLPEVGDIHLTGIVNISGFMEYTVLQNTRLAVVIDMAKQLATILHEVDQQLDRYRPLSAIFYRNREQNTSLVKQTKRLL